MRSAAWQGGQAQMDPFRAPEICDQMFFWPRYDTVRRRQ